MLMSNQLQNCNSVIDSTKTYNFDKNSNQMLKFQSEFTENQKNSVYFVDFLTKTYSTGIKLLYFLKIMKVLQVKSIL